ncbi:MAG TPA: 4-hydroxy-tetrahydrodipicolinate reductase [Bacteroidales bacterium]|nr:4-hydroxy-tetrahydrodipicolinate reductase [Bacteroidales bacterium]
MNLALIGYGRMGHEIEAIALRRGHVIKLIIDIDNHADLNSINLKGIDVAIEFSFPESALANILTCLENRVPVVSGTTGWLENYNKAVEASNKFSTSFIHSSNYSIGVNLLFKLNSELAEQMAKYRDYAVSIEEIHHTKKLDAPSGTAITIANGITAKHPGYDGWTDTDKKTERRIPVTAIREGNVPGTHIITWDSEIDSLTLKHEAKNRKGLAFGAVIAAEFINGKSGVFTMNDVMGF